MASSSIFGIGKKPDGSDITVQSYDLLMKECAEVAEKLDEGLAGVKGQLSARASRLRAK